MENNIYTKLHKARKFIKTCDVKKLGYNSFSNYDYYTPEQISQLSFMASEDQNIIPIFSLRRNELGISGFLSIQDLESDQKIVFEMASAIPEIKATNAAQQLGGAMTYTERYLLMVAFDIKDNNLDPDSGDQKPKSKPRQEENTQKEPEKWLNKWTDKEHTKENSEYWKVVNRAKEQGKKIEDLRNFYKINKEVAKELETDLL